MNIIVTYDIKRSHTDIKAELKALGYMDSIQGFSLADNTRVVQQLPNTTLIKYNTSGTRSCMEEVVKIIHKHNGGLDRIFCAELALNFDWNGQ